MENEWPELDKAVQRRKEGTDRMLREFNAKQFEQEMEQKMEIIFQEQEIYDHIRAYLEQVHRVILEWNDTVITLLRKVSDAFGNRPGKIRSLLIELPENGSHSIYWEMRFLAMYYQGWITVELQMDKSYQPVQFCVDCGEVSMIYSEVSLEGLKTALVKAYRAGPERDMNRKMILGLEIERFLNVWNT